jgi:serine/threonine protein kinase
VLHENDIIHRDIKLENILMGHDFEDIRLTDFGWAIVHETSRPLRENGGTFKYMPPEIILRRSYDNKVDSWALGFVLYELLSYSMPFEQEDPAEYRQAIVQ